MSVVVQDVVIIIKLSSKIFFITLDLVKNTANIAFYAKTMSLPCKSDRPKVFGKRFAGNKYIPYICMTNKHLMIMPEISSFYGILIYMYINEHRPPHFHVKYNEYQAIVTINEGVIRGELPRRVLSMVYEWLDLHKAELLANWDRLERMESPEKIKPLE